MISDFSLPRAVSLGLRLRTSRPDDHPFLRELYASTRVDELSGVPWSDAERAHFLAMQFEAQHAHYKRYFPQAAFKVIEEGGCPIGRLYLDEWEDELRLIDIALMPEHRGRGLGTGILRDVMAVGAMRGKAVRAHVEKTNPAQRLYTRLGYTAIEDKGVYDLLEWRPVHSALSPHRPGSSDLHT